MAQKQTARKKPAPLTYDQIDRLCRGVAWDMAGYPETAAMLMVLMRDISLHPTENAESIAIMLNSYLFMWASGEGDKAEDAYIERQRQSLLTMIEGGTQ